MASSILDIPGYTIVADELRENGYNLRLEQDPPKACQSCGVILPRFNRNGYKDIPYKDLPIHNHPTTVWVIHRRYLCSACKRVCVDFCV